MTPLYYEDGKGHEAVTKQENADRAMKELRRRKKKGRRRRAEVNAEPEKTRTESVAAAKGKEGGGGRGGGGEEARCGIFHSKFSFS